ncbi:MAG: hypothetical protein UV40_C0033G0007 [Parcubacteria group bacterium GW2011_GWA1_42_7]|nr:MAG: hypothetical protein UV34_C0036G0003 [Parcubacteria group bacterium GW2011_GWB1_42_6]KKS69120.1 MAG: hypothetical protein UV40_C0033G0007 [Parcubacteria group bacterium GW2011_GWA1_42_7]KKS92241.1 MAG: hypothetical protein UV67_C0007G0007 [Parcubacteria group bacterium GW2011_GWC1_43_12]
MKRRPYIRITGFMDQKEVSAIGDLYPEDSLGHLIMFGFLMSQKTLEGQQNKYPFKYPPRESIVNLFSRHALGMNIIHYNTDNPDGLLLQLFSMVGIYWSGNCLRGDFDGFQLNISWPQPSVIEKFRNRTNERKHFTLILQIGSKALQEVDNSPSKLADRLKDYEGLVDYLLIDQSGGRGELLNINKILDYLRAIRDLGISEEINLGIAGGLSRRTVPIIGNLMSEFPDISIDAEGCLRDSNGKLDIIETALYFLEALKVYK